MTSGPLVRAAGLIIFRVMNEFEYLLLQTSYGVHHWTPPKGHLDEGEDAITAAKRETQEEAGLAPETYDILQGQEFPFVLEYQVKNKPKKVEYWLAQLKNPCTPVQLSDEHQDLRWVNLEHAKALTKDYKDFQQLMDRVEAYLQANVKK